MISTLVSTVAVCAACGLSPLLNHTVPNRTPIRTEILAEKPEDLRCQLEFTTQNMCADFVWDQEPNRNDEGAMKIYFWSKSQTGIFANPTGVQVALKLWMPDMGHGSQKVKIAQAKETDGTDLLGVFDATEIFFVMSGAWELQFQLKDPSTGKVIETKTLPYQAQ